MTTSAWIMLGVTWSVIVFFTAKFLLKVLRSPAMGQEKSDRPPHMMAKDA